MLRLSLLRSPVSPDPNADQGHQSFSYALYPHSSDWKQALTVRHGYEFNYKLMASQLDAHAGPLPPKHSFISVSPESVVLTALKKAEDGDALIFHMYEWAGKAGSVTLTVPPGATGAMETDLLEHTQGSPLTMTADTVVAPIRPFEILALQVDYTAKPPSSAH
jgi:alpha-mannosidase